MYVVDVTLLYYGIDVILCCCSSGEERAKDVKIVAVDLQAMAPIPGVVQIQGDITKVSGAGC